MKTQLAICLPTFNRAEELDHQLTWLAEEIKDLGHLCEVIVSDNCSSDRTPAVIQKWQPFFQSVTTFRVNRNPENIGWMRNFVFCIQASNSEYTWLIGDDDIIAKGTLSFVLKTLGTRPDLSLLYLNFYGRDKVTGEITSEYWFPRGLESESQNSKVVYQRCLANIGSVIFITATIYQTKSLREAFQLWEECVDNWGALAFWSGYCATQGNVLVTSDHYVECTVGASYWQKEGRAWFGILHRDIPEIYVKLQEIGYPRRFCLNEILKIIQTDLNPNQLFTNAKYYLWCFITYPRWSSQVMSTFYTSIIISLFGLIKVEGTRKLHRESRLESRLEKSNY